MNRDQIDRNRTRIIEVIRKAFAGNGEADESAYVKSLDSSSFFTAQCIGHDETEGGMANHALWTLWFARQGSKDEKLILSIIDDCRKAESSVGSSDEETMVLVTAARQLAAEYCDCLPFGEEPLEPFEAIEADQMLDIVFDADDHRMWLGSEDYDGIFDGSETLSEFPVHHLMSVPVREDPENEDIAVLSDDAGSYALLVLSMEGDEDTASLYRSDKVMFGYTDLVFHVSRFPQYRSSYIAARNAKGRWGVLRVRENKKRSGAGSLNHRILLEKVVDFNFRKPAKALEGIRTHAGAKIGVLHPHFYSKIDLSISSPAGA